MIMGYSLGDDKESFDVFNRTEKILIDIAKQLHTNKWEFDKNKIAFVKDNKDIYFELDINHVDCIYLYSSSIDWNDFCNKNYEFDRCYGNNDDIACVVTYVSSNFNIPKMIKQLENALVLNNKDKINDSDEIERY